MIPRRWQLHMTHHFAFHELNYIHKYGEVTRTLLPLIRTISAYFTKVHNITLRKNISGLNSVGMIRYRHFIIRYCKPMCGDYLLEMALYCRSNWLPLMFGLFTAWTVHLYTVVSYVYNLTLQRRNIFVSNKMYSFTTPLLLPFSPSINF